MVAGIGMRLALQAGVGFSENGRTRSGMGIDAADLDGDGWQDLFVANVDHEMYSIYINNKDESFHDASEKLGVAHDTRLMSGWGLKYFDYDNDGKVDLFLANGHPDDMIDAYSMQVKYKEPLLLYRQGENRQAASTSARTQARCFRRTLLPAASLWAISTMMAHLM